MTVRAFGARCLGTGLAAVMMLGVTGEAQRGSPPAPEPVTPTVQAEEIASIRAQFAPGADGPAERPNHPPLDQIPPRRMPDEAAAAARRAAAGPLRMVGRDLVTGRTIVGPERTASALANAQSQGGGYAGADGRAGVSDIDQQATMSGSMSVISTASRATPPWRMNVKVVIRDGASYSVCSGTMRDAETVLTAGHCVFDFGGTGWADEIWVYPGWDGVGPHFAPPASIMNPYGWANGTALWAATGWINSGDLNVDLGLIGVTRAVGMLTGWFGWQWGGDCGYWTSQVVNNASYPAESCGGGLHTGRDMYYWSGFFDSCPSANRLQLNTTPGCTNSIWGGQSGSGVYRIEGDNRFVHGITSTSDRMSFARYSRQTQAWVEGTDIDVIPVVRGAAFDLQPLDMNAGVTSVVAGNSVGGLTHLASNPTNGGTGSGSWTFDVYLSTNDDISAADTLLSTQSYSWAWVPMQNVNINMGSVTIPSNTPAGNYYIGVIYRNTTDGNTGNNDTDGWDAVPITVLKPDLDMTLLSGPATAMPGAGINVSNTVQNIGNGAASNFRVGLYLSADSTCTTGDTFLGARSLASLGVGISSNASTGVTIPGGTPIGARFLCGIADDQSAEPESNESNNTIATAITIVQPNLRITSVAAPAMGSPGGAITIANTVNNNGTAPAGAFRVGIYLSADAVCTTGDTLLASRALAGLADGASSAANTPAPLPPGTPLSSRFVCAITDDLLAVTESNEGDNTASDPIDIVSATPVVMMKVNGLDPTPPVVPTAGPANVTISIPPTTYTGSLSWYWAIVYNGTLSWVTPGGVSPTPAPFVVSPPVVLTDVSLLNITLPTATTMTNAIFLVDGGGAVVASDFITATRP